MGRSDPALDKGLSMAIIIRQLGGNPMGVCEYEIRINADRITTFKHSRPNGLRACLLAAADAVERQKWRDIETFLLAAEGSDKTS